MILIILFVAEPRYARVRNPVRDDVMHVTVLSGMT